MISRRSANHIGQCYANEFADEWVDTERLYDFLFDRDFPVWLCNSVKSLNRTRTLKEHIMRLHTGETQFSATRTWTQERRRTLGQTYLQKLAVDLLNTEVTPEMHFDAEQITSQRDELLSSLQLDGFEYRNKQLIPSEADVLDSEEAMGVLEELSTKLQLDNRETAMHCLKLSEEHWLNKNWDDCISNARRFLESTMQEVAAAHSKRIKQVTLDEQTLSRPFKVRDYLEEEGLIERQEMAAIKETYGFLSATGSHPYIAAKDQAKLLRHIALLYAQFVMLRFQGFLAQSGS